MNISFYDEHGQTVKLTSLIDKPTVISLVYYRCPGICTPLLSGLTNVIEKSDLIPGKDYNVITISFDHTENYLTASEKKKNYFETINKKLDYNSWRFLTADSFEVKRLTDAVGFRYQKQGNDYMHGTALIVLSPEGKIIRYLYGVEYLPLDFKLAIIEAGEGRVGASINKILKLCYSYDPQGRKYVVNFTRIAGGGIVVLLIIFLAFLTIKKNKYKPNK